MTILNKMEDLIHGAKWWKFDFHNHTPASMDYGKGDESLKAISPEDWLLLYMRAEIDCVAITDHNTGDWIDKLKAALVVLDTTKPVGYRPLHLFPGVEISVNGNTHILAIFDNSYTATQIAALLGAIKFPAANFGTSDAVTGESLIVVLEEIVKAGGIAIPAHVDKPSGLFINVAGHTLTQALQVDGLLAIELIDKTYAKPELYKQAKLNLAEIVGTDSHIPAQVGTNYTWVKMHTPSLEALKLALHDGEDGVIRMEDALMNPNTISSRYFIKSVVVENAFKAGNGTALEAKFSPWLTSIIGGRGSGKSTILNFLRIALSRHSDMPDQIQNDFNDFNKIGKKNSSGMLRDNSIIKVELFKDGKLHLVIWNQLLGKNTTQTWDDVSGVWNAPTEVTNINDLFPVQIFSQKELYSLTNNPSKLIELIDSQFDKQTWQEAKEKLVEKWLSQRLQQRQLNSAIADESNLKAQLESVGNRIKLFESSAFKETLNKYNTYNSVNKFFDDTSNSITSFITDFSKFSTSFPVIAYQDEIKDAIDEGSAKYIIDLNEAVNKAKQKFEEAIALLKPYNENLTEQLNKLPWKEEFDKAKEAYNGIAEQIKELGSESYETLILRRNTLNEKLLAIEENKKLIASIEAASSATYLSIIESEKKLRENRINIINRWKQNDNTDNPFLIIELLPMSEVSEANASFRLLIRKQGAEFSGAIYQVNDENDESTGIIAELVKEPEATRWDKRLEIVNRLITATETEKNGFDTRLIRHIEALRTNTPEDIDRLLVWVPEDKLVLKFKKQDKIQDIQQGSAGERTAGMLGLLLALNDIPLIIDQPEDDLDTRLISNFVVPGFKNLKKTRQLILVTHNPNIAVNGNSDNVIYMNYVTGQVVVSGNNALQDKDIRTAVCDVMEGGRDALNKRYYRISKALK